jgi:hypothetical protein
MNLRRSGSKASMAVNPAPLWLMAGVLVSGFLLSCANKVNESVSYESSALERKAIGESQHEDSFLTILRDVEPQFGYLDQKYPGYLEAPGESGAAAVDFETWFRDFLQLCLRPANKIVLDVMVAKGILKQTGPFQAWCALSFEGSNANLFRYLRWVDPEAMEKDRRLRTFDAFASLVKTELARVEAGIKASPVFVRFLKQLHCTQDPSTEAFMRLFEEQVHGVITDRSTDASVFKVVEAYYVFFKSRGWVPTVHPWRWYEYLASVLP